MVTIEWSTTHFINGLFVLIAILVSIIIGSLIALKYRKYKLKIFLYWGFAWFGFYIPWWGAAISFVNALITQETISIQLYLFFGVFFIPPFMVAWIYGLTEMILKEKRKILIFFYIFITVSYDIYIIIALIIDPKWLYNTIDGFDISYKLIHISYLLFMNISLVITSTLFALDFRKSKKKEARIKSLFIFTACILFFITALIDGSPIGLINDIFIIINRFMLIFSSILFYIGMFMPKFIKKLLMKNWTDEEVDLIPEHIENAETFLNLLRSRPKTITIEDVIYYREQKLCLVCKGKIGDTKYLCDCGALYCTKCTFALIQIENICWACENALDKTRPIKMAEWVEDNIAHVLPEEVDPEQEKKK